MTTLEDLLQSGMVVSVASKPVSDDNSIKKVQQSRIELAPGGVVGDSHFQLDIKDDSNPRIKLSELTNELQDVVRQGGRVIATAQISLFELEEQYQSHVFTEFKTAGIGLFGENITTVGIRLNEIRLGSIIKIGTATIKVVCRRSFCKRMLVDYKHQPFWWFKRNLNKLGELKIGILCQVVDSGTVRPGDSIQVIPNPELVGKPWQPLPIAGSRFNHWANRVEAV